MFHVPIVTGNYKTIVIMLCDHGFHIWVVLIYNQCSFTLVNWLRDVHMQMDYCLLFLFSEASYFGNKQTALLNDLFLCNLVLCIRLLLSGLGTIKLYAHGHVKLFH